MYGNFRTARMSLTLPLMRCLTISLAILVLLAPLISARIAPVGPDWVQGSQNRTNRQRRLASSSFGATGFNLFAPSTNTTFDYVVVGGGNAGIPMAVRLAEAGYTVALVEAGSFTMLGNSNFSQIPLFAAVYSFPDPENPATIAPMVDWQQTFSTPFQPNRTQMIPAGKTLGGSSARSHKAYQFGTKGSYQAWADAVGDQSYAWDEFKSYLRKPMSFAPPAPSRFANSSAKFDTELEKLTTGPVPVTFGGYAWAFSSWAEQAFSQAGIGPRKDAFAAGALLGSGYPLFSLSSQSFLGQSSESTYLQNLGLENPNLLLYLNSLATRILFDTDKNATGVEIDFSGTTLTLHARREVIVSAGVFRSPQLLMVSGVGPAAILNEQNISVVADLRGVGQNLMDHPVTGSISRRVNVQTTAQFQSSEGYFQKALDYFLSTPASGPLSAFASDFMAFEKLPSKLRQNLSATTQAALAQLDPDWPETEILVNSGYIGQMTGFIGSADGLDWAAMLVALDAPFSRGNVTIRSRDAHDNPVVHPGWLSDSRDQEVAVQAFRRLQDLFNQSSLQGVLIGEDAFPAAGLLETDEGVLELVQETVGTANHFAGTCKMGRASDPLAVVDSAGRVFGVGRLRVVDASIFPILPPGHPSGTVCECLVHRGYLSKR